MKITIYSPYDCIIKVGETLEAISENEHLVMDNDKKEITIYPSKKSSQYSFALDLKNSASPFYRTIEKNGELLIFLLDGLVADNVNIFSFSHNEKQSYVEVGKDKIIFKSESNKKTIPLPCKPSNICCGNFKHINYVSYEDEKKHFLIAYNTQNGKSKLFQGNEIEIKENGFIVTNEKNNFFKKVVEEYFIDEDGLKSKSKVFSRKTIADDNMLCYEFITSIKFKDYQNALNLLTPSLQENIDENALKKYFGDISYFYMIDPLSCFALSNDENKIFVFNIKENKICEISDSFQ